MEYFNESVIEELYYSNMVTNMDESEEYIKLINKYNKIFDSIKDEKLKNKLTKINEIRNDLFSESHKTSFKIGFSLGVKLIIESLNDKKK